MEVRGKVCLPHRKILYYYMLSHWCGMIALLARLLPLETVHTDADFVLTL